MKRTLLFLAAVLLLFSLPLLAQEKEESKEATPSIAPPSALTDDMCTWMIGEWDGWTESPNGKMKDWDKFEWGLENQFVIMHATSKTTDMTEEQKAKVMEAYGMSKEDVEKMIQMTYKGMGPVTIDPVTGDTWGTGSTIGEESTRGRESGTGTR